MLIRERWVRPAVMDYADCVRCRSAPRRRRAARIKQRDFTRRLESSSSSWVGSALVCLEDFLFLLPHVPDLFLFSFYKLWMYIGLQ